MSRTGRSGDGRLLGERRRGGAGGGASWRWCALGSGTGALGVSRAGEGEALGRLALGRGPEPSWAGLEGLAANRGAAFRLGVLLLGRRGGGSSGQSLRARPAARRGEGAYLITSASLGVLDEGASSRLTRFGGARCGGVGGHPRPQRGSPLLLGGGATTGGERDSLRAICKAASMNRCARSGRGTGNILTFTAAAYLLKMSQ